MLPSADLNPKNCGSWSTCQTKTHAVPRSQVSPMAHMALYLVSTCMLLSCPRHLSRPSWLRLKPSTTGPPSVHHSSDTETFWSARRSETWWTTSTATCWHWMPICCVQTLSECLTRSGSKFLRSLMKSSQGLMKWVTGNLFMHTIQ